MSRGGARSRSGPPRDPNSGRSERRGVQETLRVLPAEGYDGDPPKWPFPAKGTKKRERDLWKEVWTYPQACAWAEEQWHWNMVAQYVRWSVRAEDPEAPASTMAQAIRLADSIGLTAAGLLQNGWKIVAKTETEEAAEPTNTPPATPTRRLRAVNEQ